MMYWNGGHMDGWGYVLMTIGMVLLWGLVIFAIVALVGYMVRAGRNPLTGPPAPPVPPRAAEQLLAERFARGEIDAEEYRHRLETLRDAGQSSGKP